MMSFTLTAIIAAAAAWIIQGWETHAFSFGHHSRFAATQQRPSPVQSFRPSWRSFKPLCMATEPNIDSNDPFQVLGLDPNDRDSLEKKVIKRAYKRLALKYHPDVATNRDSTPEEKKRASDQFAKINAAYETLLGKREGNFASSSSASSSAGWTPPHRRKPGESSYSSSSSSYHTNSGGTSWEDFMPKYDDAQYDAGGDSFGSIFADLLAGAAGSVASGGSSGVFIDFVEFLERNVDGYGSVPGGSRSGTDDDADLAFLLQTGTVDEVGEELDDTELVVQQLSTKLRDLENELLTIQADLAASSRFSEKIALEEQEAECNARKGVVDNYLKRARKRLLSLQTRYKQLIVGGANDNKAGGRSRSSSAYTESSSYSSAAGRTETSNSRRAVSSDPEDAWKTEGFGSSGRRGSGRRRTSRSSQRSSEPSTSSSSRSSSQYRTTNASSNQNRDKRTDSRPSPQQPSQSTSPTDDNVPPHRRTRAPQAQDDKQRLRELQVDDEFEKLKKELGL